MTVSLTRPLGTSSVVRRGRGARSSWVAANGVTVDLPLVVDLRDVGPDGSVKFQVDATIDLVDSRPRLVDLRVRARGLDVGFLQEHFRWSTPLHIVTVTVPELLAIGVDPLNYLYPVTGFPEAAHVSRAVPTRLTDAFLTEIALRYRLLGRGYARVIAAERHVSPRTVVSWIEKARERGILSGTTAGKMSSEVRHGGSVRKVTAT